MNGVDALLAFTVAVAALVQATTGIGFALIVAPVWTIFQPQLLPGALLLLMIPLNAWVAWRERGHIDRSGVGWITAGRVAGAVCALGVLASISLRGLSLLIGASTLAAVAASLLAPKFRPNRGAFVAAGAVTGVTETATGIGGPPLALVFQHEPPSSLRANVALCFLIGELLSVALLVPAGLISRDQTRAALLVLPAVAVGVFGSIPLRPRVDARTLRTAVLAFAALSSLWIVGSAF